MKKRKFISQYSIIDSETSEVKDLKYVDLKLPEIVGLEGHFLKCYERAITALSPLYIGRLVKLWDNIEWGTNRLVKKHVGRKTIPLKQKCISKILSVNIRTISSMISELKEKKAIFKMHSYYFVNPTFMGKARRYDADIIIEMIKIDSEIIKYVTPYQKKHLKLFLAIDKLDW